MIGLGIASAISLAAGDDTDTAPGCEVAGGKSCRGVQERSRKHRHELEVYGG